MLKNLLKPLIILVCINTTIPAYSMDITRQLAKSAIMKGLGAIIAVPLAVGGFIVGSKTEQALIDAGKSDSSLQIRSGEYKFAQFGNIAAHSFYNLSLIQAWKSVRDGSLERLKGGILGDVYPCLKKLTLQPRGPLLPWWLRIALGVSIAGNAAKCLPIKVPNPMGDFVYIENIPATPAYKILSKNSYDSKHNVNIR